jgi:predicted peptidase
MLTYKTDFLLQTFLIVSIVLYLWKSLKKISYYEKRIITFMCLFSLEFVAAQDEYERSVFVSSSGDSLNYRLLEPEVMQAGEKYPLVLFLHGAGERGNDNEKQLTHGGQMFLNPVNREKYPAFVLFPQCPESGYWAYENRPQSFIPTQMPVGKEMPSVFQAVKELLDMYLANPQVDKSRIYIMGLSMGAMGTYDMVSRFPDIFAAAVPICGTVNPMRLSAARNVAFRIFHGDADDVVPVAGSRQAYKALKAAGASVEYIEFPGCNHGSWNPAFNYPDFMKWLFTQKKK